MRQSVVSCATFVLLTSALPVHAGPVEDVAQIAGPRMKAFEAGDLDGWMAAYADNAVLTAFMVPFRVDGKEAIRAHFARLFQAYPGRGSFVRQPAARAYNDDLVVQNGYMAMNWSDSRGQPMDVPVRISTVWAKIGGRWQIVDQHVSRLPASDH